MKKIYFSMLSLLIFTGLLGVSPLVILPHPATNVQLASRDHQEIKHHTGIHEHSPYLTTAGLDRWAVKIEANEMFAGADSLIFDCQGVGFYLPDANNEDFAFRIHADDNNSFGDVIYPLDSQDFVSGTATSGWNIVNLSSTISAQKFWLVLEYATAANSSKLAASSGTGNNSYYWQADDESHHADFINFASLNVHSELLFSLFGNYRDEDGEIFYDLSLDSFNYQTSESQGDYELKPLVKITNNSGLSVDNIQLSFTLSSADGFTVSNETMNLSTPLAANSSYVLSDTESQTYAATLSSPQGQYIFACQISSADVLVENTQNNQAGALFNAFSLPQGKTLVENFIRYGATETTTIWDNINDLDALLADSLIVINNFVDPADEVYFRIAARKRFENTGISNFDATLINTDTVIAANEENYTDTLLAKTRSSLTNKSFITPLRIIPAALGDSQYSLDITLINEATQLYAWYKNKFRLHAYLTQANALPFDNNPGQVTVGQISPDNGYALNFTPGEESTVHLEFDTSTFESYDMSASYYISYWVQHAPIYNTEYNFDLPANVLYTSQISLSEFSNTSLVINDFSIEIVSTLEGTFARPHLEFTNYSNEIITAGIEIRLSYQSATPGQAVLNQNLELNDTDGILAHTTYYIPYSGEPDSYDFAFPISPAVWLVKAQVIDPANPVPANDLNTALAAAYVFNGEMNTHILENFYTENDAITEEISIIQSEALSDQTENFVFPLNFYPNGFNGGINQVASTWMSHYGIYNIPSTIYGGKTKINGNDADYENKLIELLDVSKEAHSPFNDIEINPVVSDEGFTLLVTINNNNTYIPTWYNDNIHFYIALAEDVTPPDSLETDIYGDTFLKFLTPEGGIAMDMTHGNQYFDDFNFSRQDLLDITYQDTTGDNSYAYIWACIEPTRINTDNYPELDYALSLSGNLLFAERISLANLNRDTGGQVNAAPQVSIYPNPLPADGTINIRWSNSELENEKMTVEIFNIKGQRKLRKEFDNSTSAFKWTHNNDGKTPASGIYLFKVTRGSASRQSIDTQKILYLK